MCKKNPQEVEAGETNPTHSFMTLTQARIVAKPKKDCQ